MQKIELKNDSFELGGKLWHIADDITVGRLPELEKLLNHFINGIELGQQQVILKEVYDDMNSMKFADAGRKLYNLLNAVNIKSAGMHNVKLLIATMFINEKNENIKKWNIELANYKIDAWGDGNASFFFLLCDKLLRDILSKIFEISGSSLEALITLGNARTPNPAVTEQMPLNILKSKIKLKKNGHK